MSALEFDDLLGFGASDEGLEDIEDSDYTSPVELLGAVEDDMSDLDFEEAVDQEPELLGRAFGSLFRRLKYRRKLMRKFKRLPRRKRRKLVRAMVKRRHKRMAMTAAAGAAIPLMRLVPGSRIALAIMKRRARKRGLTLGQYLRKRRARRRKRKKARRVKRIARRSRRRSVPEKRIASTYGPFSRAVAPSPISAFQEEPQAIEDIAEREGPEAMEAQPAKKSTAAKLIPLAALAALPFILG